MECDDPYLEKKEITKLITAQFIKMGLIFKSTHSVGITLT